MKPLRSARSSCSRLALAGAFAAAGLAAALITPLPAAAHGAAAHMVPLKKAMETFGASVRWDAYAGVWTITRNSVIVRVKPRANTALVNGQSVALPVPLVMKGDQPYVSDEFINTVFAPSLDKTFQIESVPHPLNPLTAAEINATIEVLKASGHYQPQYRFTEVTLAEPPKDQVWQFALGNSRQAFERRANFTLLDGRNVIEGTVDLGKRSLERWEPKPGVHGMVLVDDFETVQTSLESSPDYVQAIARRGITDMKKVIATPLTVGYFGGKDALQEDSRLLKVVSYLDVGDGNYWAHPIENLVAVVDVVNRKVVKVEDNGVIPVPLKPTGYDGRGRTLTPPPKPLEISEPDGKNYTITGNTLHWRNWEMHFKLDSRVGLMFSTVTYQDRGKKRQIMYEGSLGGMIVPYGDPDVGWYFKAYLDSGEYGMGTLTSSIERGKDAPENVVLLDATIADSSGKPRVIPRAIGVFERYAGPEFKHQEYGQPNLSVERRELVIRWISTVGNYDYIFDWVFAENGTIGINAGATGIEAVKGVKSATMRDATATEDTRYGTLIDHNIVGTTHQHIYNFRLDLDIDGQNNSLTEVDPVVLPNTRGGPRSSTMQTVQRTAENEQQAAQKFDASTIRLLSNPNKFNKVGNPVSYQLIPYAGGTHPIARGANFAQDEWINRRLSFMDRQLWVTRYDPEQRFPEGKYPNRSQEDTGLGAFVKDNQSIVNQDDVVWLTTGTTHVARAEEWPIMPTEWVHVLLKPWNFFDETPTLGLNQKK